MEGFPVYNFSWWKDFQSTIFLMEGFPVYNFSWWEDYMSTIFLMEGFPEYNVPGGRISRVQFSW
jgi:hypothetical protein